MAHQTGSATGPIDLLDKLRLFCIAQSITVNEYRTEGTAPGQLLSVTFNGGFFSIGFDVTGNIYQQGYALTQASGWNASTAWGSQPDETAVAINGGTRATGVDTVAAIPTYHFTYFTGGVVMVSFVIATGAWRHFCFGDIEKYGTYTGGAVIIANHHLTTLGNTDNPYIAGHVLFGMTVTLGTLNFGGYIRVDDGGVKFRKLTGLGATDIRMSSNWSSGRGLDNRLNGTSPAGPTQASSLHPIAFAVPIADGSVKHSPVGVLRDIRFCNVQYLDNEQVFDTNWLAFSQGIKNDPDARPGTENSGYQGIAVKVL